MIFVKETLDRGRGVFTDTPIKKGDVIEICPYLEVVSNDSTGSYVFISECGEKHVLAFGFGSLYNHDNTPNMIYEFDSPARNIIFIANRDIKANEELTHDYGDNYEYTWETNMKKVTANFDFTTMRKGEKVVILANEKAKQISNTTLSQLGGNKFIVMTGAKNFSYDKEGSLSFMIGKNAKKVTHIKIALVNDEYVVTFYNIRGTNLKILKEIKGVPSENLRSCIARETGMHLSL